MGIVTRILGMQIDIPGDRLHWSPHHFLPLLQI
jgi:hypothetical protein